MESLSKYFRFEGADTTIHSRDPQYRRYFYRSRENSTQNATFQHEHEHEQTQHGHFSFHSQFLKTNQSNL